MDTSEMDFKSEVCSFSRPAAMFKTLRRLHGHNLENQGLNNLSEAFKNFVTRARFFSIGRLRRTWSHSAVEFLKYRRLLPMLTSDGQIVNQLETFGDLSLEPLMSTRSDLGRKDSESTVASSRTKSDDKKIIVRNISPRVTTNQLISFFSKFGTVVNCHVPTEDRRHSLYATLPKKSNSTLTAFLTFKKVEEAERAKNAIAEELQFYNKVMVVSSFSSSKKKSIISVGDQEDTSSLPDFMMGSSLAPRSTTICTIADVGNLFGVRKSLSILPAKVLTLILFYTPPVDRIRCERVNKSFLESAAQAWAISESFSFASENVGRMFNQSNPLRNTHLREILTRCGFHLKVLDMSGVVHLLDDQAFEIISSLCPNLEKVNLSGVNGHWCALRNFGEALKYLKSLIYCDMANVTDKELWYLLNSIGANICEADFRGCRRIKGRFLRLFGPVLNKLTLDGCNRIDEESLEDLCLESPNLSELRISGCWHVSDETLSLISRNLKRLTTFTLCGDRFYAITSTGLMTVTRLRNLVELCLDYNSAVTDAFIIALSESLTQLRVLTMAYAGSDMQITTSSLMKLSNLRQLETLDISSLAAVTSNVVLELVHGCSELHTLHFRSCTYLSDTGVSEIAKLKYLEHLDLSGCLLVSSQSVQVLVNAFPSGRNLHAVTIVIGGTICDSGSLYLKGSRVVLDNSDYSALSSTTARGLLSSSSGYLDVKADSDDSLSDDEFASLVTHRSFIIDALHDEEDESPMENQKSINEWAEREARNLGLITDEATS